MSVISELSDLHSVKHKCTIKVYKNIVKGEFDQRLYRGLELENGMRILLISDPKADKSAASVNVHVGSLSEPILGLAHFCEHMLFLGSRKYPKENTFSKFIQEHGGIFNAFTAPDNTNYFFDISNESLLQALDIFSQFFISPLFDPNSTDREINAVNSENNNNLQSDVWRINQFERSLCKSTHPYSRFGTGNITTLKTEPEQKGINIRDELIKFHSKYYSSNIMTACILGVESLDTLQDYVVKMFSGVPNKNVQINEFESNPFNMESLQNIHFVVPVQDMNQLNLTFQLPDYREHYDSNPTHYISHLIGDEGPGSLLSELKARGWCNGLLVGPRLGARGFQFFTVTFDLTPEGIDHILEIIYLFYQYLNLLRRDGISESIYKELADLSKNRFTFKDIEDPIQYVSALTDCLHRFKMNDVLRARFVLTKYDPKLIQEVVNLMTPELMVAIAISKRYEQMATSTEKWYGTKYHSELLPIELWYRWHCCGFNQAFKLPEPNNFIPNDYSLITHYNGITKFPEIIKKTPYMRVWYKGDDKFLLPKATFKFEIRNPASNLNPKHWNTTELYLNLLQDSLNELTYAIDLAGLGYTVTQTQYGIVFTFNGFSDKLEALVETVIKRFTTLKIDERRFEILKENYKRVLLNFQAEQPYTHAMYYLFQLLIERDWSINDLLFAVDSVSLADVQRFVIQLLSSGLFIESLMFGNMAREQTLKIMQVVENYLAKIAQENRVDVHPLPQSKLANLRQVELPNSCDNIYVHNNDIHPIIGYEVYFQCEAQNTKNDVLVDLFCQIVKEDTYSVLRTQEQLGYIVDCGVRRFNGLQGVHFIIQSDKSPTFLDRRIENFILQTKYRLVNMSEQEFNTYVNGLKVMKLDEAKSLSQQFEIYWNEISLHEYNFDRKNIEVACLDTIKKSDLIEFYDRHISPLSPNRKKLAVYVIPSFLNPDVPKEVQMKQIHNISGFKAKLTLCPQPKPYINI